MDAVNLILIIILIWVGINLIPIIVDLLLYLAGTIFFFFADMFESKVYFDHKNQIDMKKSSFDYDKYVFMSPAEACEYISECKRTDEIQVAIDKETLQDRINQAKFNLEKKRLL